MLKNSSNAIGIFIIIFLFIIFALIGYRFLKKQTETNHIKDSKIFFYEIQHDTNSLLTKLWHNYESITPKIVEVHKEVEKYLTTHNYDAPLDEIYQKINQNHKTKPYNIYITDDNLTITNTTFKPDLGFNLLFSKSSFDRHRAKGIIKPCFPLFEKSSKGFMSYSDSYLPKDGGNRLLQISYSYPKSNKKLKELQDVIKTYKSISKFKVYLFLNSGFINDIILSDYTSYKPKNNEILSRIKEGEEINKKISDKKLFIEQKIINNKAYKILYLKAYSPIFPDTYMIYTVMFDESDYIERLHNLDMIIFIITILGIVSLFVVWKIWNKEKLLEAQDNFVKSAMHEIGTPLSVIMCNHELREEIYGSDEYSQEITSAVKVLKNSYDDISFLVTKDKLVYNKELIDIASILQDRVQYFQTIAKSNDKNIICHIKDKCIFEISIVEIFRLIDNNLSNAIKYSHRDTTITVTFENKTIYFHSIGEVIADTNSIFEKYKRENKFLGGYGLGLNIVQQIATKYDIKKDITSSKKSGTTFSYRFKCH